MAQALLNNLNIQQDGSFSLKDNNLKNVIGDFEKIFDKKTSENKTDNKNIKVETETDVRVEAKDTQEDTITEEKPIIKTIGDMKLELNTNFESLKAEFDNAVQESIADAIVDLTILKEELTEEEEIAAIDIEEEEETEELNPTTEEDSTEEIITEEDPTMYKELTTLENPTVAIMLHSQIQKSVNSTDIQENAATKLDNNLTFTKSESQNSDNSNLFKQFDTTTSKDIIADLPKDSSALKTETLKTNKSIDAKIVRDLNVKIVENNTDNGENNSSGDLMQQQTPQEQVAKIMIQGNVKFDKLAFDTLKMTTEIKPTEVSASKIIEQISKQLDGMYNNSKLNMVLNPGTLGKVHLHIINSKEGLVAQFTVTTQEAKDILMKGLSGLKESLLSQGINVDNVSVKFEETADRDGQSDWTEQEGSRGGNKQQGSQKQQKEQEKPFEQMMFELENNGKV